MLLFEFPFSEITRTYLRLESLFNRLHVLMERRSQIDHHYALQTLFEMVELGLRTDVKSEILKDLEKQRQHLQTFRGHVGANQSALEHLLLKFNSSYEQMNMSIIKGNQWFAEDDLLQSLKSRMGVAAGTCSFDLPGYHFWLDRHDSARHRDIHQWQMPFVPIMKAVDLLLSVMRETGMPQKVIAQTGVYQQNLSASKHHRLLRVWVETTKNLVPEFSGNRLLISLRFMKWGIDRKWMPCQADVNFEICLCS